MGSNIPIDSRALSSLNTACAYITATHLMHARASPDPAHPLPFSHSTSGKLASQHSSSQIQVSLVQNHPFTSVPTQRHTIAVTPKATPADNQSSQAMPHAQRNLEARRPPRWSGRQLFRRGACCFDFVIAWSCWDRER